MIEKPPSITTRDYYNVLPLKNDKGLNALVEKANEEYAYWSDVKYKPLPEGITPKMLWSKIKLSRLLISRSIGDKYGVKVSVTNWMQRLCHEFDMRFGGSWGSSSVIPEESKTQYLVSSLMEEAISSSQMEGASTTRRVAKDMLQKGMTPRDKSQRMIFNNYQTIHFIVERKDAPMTPEMLLKVHALMTDRTLTSQDDCGCFRTNDDVVVENGITHETVHVPPPCKDIPEFVEWLCTFFNEEKAEVFIHPVIRGILIHYMVAFVHPFVDGNGRTARALFYWYMLHRGYWLTEYMSISRMIARSKKSYEKAFLYSEVDGNDAGYFIAYHLRIVELAFKQLQQYISRMQREKKEMVSFLSLGNINEREAEIVRLLYDSPEKMLTIKEVQLRFGVTPTTAKNDVSKLMEKGLLTEVPLNKIKKGYIKSPDFDIIVGKIFK